MKTIRSRDNALVKQLVALAHSSRERRKAGLTVLDGIHLVEAYVKAVKGKTYPGPEHSF